MRRLIVFFTQSLQRKLIVALMLVVGVVMGAVGVIWVNNEQQQATTELEARATRMAHLLAESAALPLWNFSEDSVAAQLEAVMADPEVQAVAVYETGKDQPTIERHRTETAEDAIQREAVIVFNRDQKMETLGRVQITYTRRYLYQSLRQTQFQIAGMILALTTTLAGATYFLLGRLAQQPIQQLAGLARRIANGDLDARIQITAQDEIGQLAETCNQMAAQLQASHASLKTLNQDLEAKVAARTHDLQVAADVSRQITTFLSLDELLQQVALLTAQSYDLCGCFVLILDNDQRALVYASGADAQGVRLRSPVFKQLPLEARPSIIALAARQREAVVVNDVRQSSVYLAQPTLEAVRSEAAIPMLRGELLLGVFDLQSAQVDRFSPEDLRVLTTLAEQVAIAVRNAQLFAEAQAARAEAEAANQLKSKFLTNMSHELRTPLNAIINFAYLLNAGPENNLTEDQLELITRIEASGRHLLGVINDILDLAKIEAGKLQLQFENDIDLSEIVADALATTAGLLKNKPVELRQDLPAQLPRLRADRMRVRQILLNLLSNAAKFTAQGAITLRVQIPPHAPVITLSVQDSGIGIAAQDIPKIFQEFEQIEGRLTPTANGTGLGIPISKKFVELHGGQMWVESEVGRGSTFFFTLPCVEAADLAPAVAEALLVG